jgi:hypothetical protein
MKIINILYLVIFAVAVSGCKKETDLLDIQSLTLTLSKDKILSDGVDSASIKIVNQTGLDVKEYVTIYNNDMIFSQKAFRSTTPSISKIYASFGNIKSNEVVVEVIEDKNLKFEKNVLIEQYTGTWCGWCPRAIFQIENLQVTDKNIAHIALHLSDEMTFNMSMMLFQSFGFTGIPTIHADRSLVWNGNNGAISPLHSPARAGLAIKVSGASSNVTADVKLKFGMDFSENLKLSVYLLDDGLIANQANNYNDEPSSPYYKKGSPMVNFIHKNVLIKIGTDMFGDGIPADSIGIRTTYSRTFNFTGINPDHLGKIKVVAFITYTNGSKIDTVLNCIIGAVGDNKDFVTVSY